jgi:hypothetical protein
VGMMDYDDAVTRARGETLRQDYGPPGDPGSGWVTFASLMLGLAGIMNIIAGIAAIADSRVYGEDATFIFSNLNTWGWIILILGAAQILAALAIFSGSELARWFGVACAGVNAIGQLLYVDAYPFWALSLFAIDILIIYGLVAYAGSQLRKA